MVLDLAEALYRLRPVANLKTVLNMVMLVAAERGGGRARNWPAQIKGKLSVAAAWVSLVGVPRLMPVSEKGLFLGWERSCSYSLAQ
jgi:hypothetical protein